METSLPNRNICLLLLIGIPGSGKTYFANFMVNHLPLPSLNSDTCFTDLSIVPISYDDYIFYKNEADLKDWKQKRKNIFKAVEEFILNFKCYENELTNNLFINNYIDINKSNAVIIIDDNMYYKSMRYEYYQLAKKFGIGFCQIYLEATLQKAIEYNKKRDSLCVVPNSVIDKMYHLIEIPNRDNNNWEYNSLILPAFIDFGDSGVLIKIRNLIKTSFDFPIKISIIEDKEESKKITDSNLIHQLDIKLRGLMRNYLTEVKKLKSHDVRSTANLLNANRLNVINCVKTGSLVLPSDIVIALQSKNKNQFDESSVNNYFVNLLTNINID